LGDIARARGSFVLTQRFFWEWSPSLHSFANTSKTAGRIKLEFSHNVGITKVANFEPPGHVTKDFMAKKSKIEF